MIHIEMILNEMFEARTEDSYGEVKYLLKPRNNDYGHIANKVIKLGAKKIISLKADMEEICGYAYLFIYESLLDYDGDYYDIVELEQYIMYYCYCKFFDLSKDNGVNKDFYYNKRLNKFENVQPYELKECIVRNQEAIEEDLSKTKETEFIRKYMTSEYLTAGQVRYVENALKYGLSSGGAIYNEEGEELYSKQLSYDYRQKIKKKLRQEYENHFTSESL